MLKSSIKNAKKFLDLFYEPEINGHELTKKTKLSLFILRIDAGRFAYEDVKRELGNAAMTYVFSRVKFDDIKPDQMHENVKIVQERFRDGDVNDGEGGEIFLYCFLETHLGAPKILSKMELKTAGNDYIKGSDGIHLLNLGDGVFHLIFGESKMISDSTEKGSSFRKAISVVFESIKKVESSGIGNEINLVDSNLMKETYDKDQLEYLKRILKPSARDIAITKYNAFGIFVGFEIDISDWDLQQIDDIEFEKRIKKEIMMMVEDRYDYIKERIMKENLSGYHFYIYAVPFIKNKELCLDATRKDIIRHIQ